MQSDCVFKFVTSAGNSRWGWWKVESIEVWVWGDGLQGCSQCIIGIATIQCKREIPGARDLEPQGGEDGQFERSNSIHCEAT